MAELLLKALDSPTFKDGDVLCAFTDRRIHAVYAEHICNVKNFGFNSDGLRPESLAEQFLELAYQYRFDRVADSVVRTEILTGLQDVLGKTPNAAGESINVELYLKRRIESPKHKIFGVKGSEYWFGGKVNSDSSSISNIWNHIEANTINRKSDHSLWPLTEGEKAQHVTLFVENFSDAEANELTAPLLDANDKHIKLRKNSLNIEDMNELSMGTITLHRDPAIIVDNRAGAAPILFKNKVIS